VKAGLVPGDAEDLAQANQVRDRPASVRPAFIGLFALFTLVVVGGGVLQYIGRAGAHRVRAGERPLELAPPNAGALRVLVTPWADVWIDGQRVDTTPFARAIPLPAGKHYVTFKHPSVTDEKREVEIVAGETALLDVDLGVLPPEAPAPATDAGARAAGSDARRDVPAATEVKGLAGMRDQGPRGRNRP
jgi:serine/threonine-protein kinase